MNIIAWSIVACEILFWIFILVGLGIRYLMKKESIGFILLALTPVIDLILLVITGVDLYHGATATKAHAIAAIYLGVSIAYGKSIIRWTDEKFQYYVLKQGNQPTKRVGLQYAIQYFKGWLKHLLAYCIGSGLLIATIFLIHQPAKTIELFFIFKLWSLALGIDLIISLSYFIWRK